MSEHIGIAGAGLLGRLIAWRLLKFGYRVSLFDAGSFIDSPSAAHTAAGMISPVSEAIDTEPLMFDLGQVALDVWPKWLSELPELPVVQYGQTGSLIIAHPRDQSLLQHYLHDMRTRLPVGAQGQLVSGNELRALEPDIDSPFTQGLWLTHESHIDNRALLNSLLLVIQSLGGQCIERQPVDVFPGELHAGDQVHSFDRVIDCRGVGAKPQAPEVRGVRGEILRVSTSEVSITRPVRLLHPRYQLYVVPKPNDEYVIGATQIESEDTSPVSVQSSLELNSALYAINPAFSEARIIEMRANLRPALNDNRPQINWSDRLIRVNGLYRHGYLLAPVVVEHVIGQLNGQADLAFSRELFHFHPAKELRCVDAIS